MSNSKHRDSSHQSRRWTGYDLLNQDPIIETHHDEPPGLAMGCAFALGIVGLFMMSIAGVIYLTIGIIN